MRKIILTCMLIVVVLFSCTSDNSTTQFKAVLQSLNSSNIFIENSNDIIYGSLERKLTDPRTRAKAELLQPRTDTLKKIFDSALLYINQLRGELKTLSGTIIKEDKELIDIDDRSSVEQLFFKENKGKELANKIKSLKSKIVDLSTLEELVDYPTMKRNFQNQMNDIINKLPINDDFGRGAGGTVTTKSHYSDYFKNTHVLGAMVMLAKIQNEVLRSEHLVIDLINTQTAYHEHGVYERTHAIFAQNTTVLKSGQEIEITAGIGFFNAASKPTFTINGQVTTIDADGVAIYKLKLKQAPGKYTIPVKVEFTKPDGTSMIVTRKIEYQVVK